MLTRILQSQVAASFNKVASASTTELLMVAATVLLICYLTNRRRRGCYPPGPTPWPFLGNLCNVIKLGGILEFYQYCQKKYGEVFSVQYAGVQYVVVSGFSNMQQLLLRNGNVTSRRNIDLMPPSYDIHNMKSRPGIMFSANWRELRQRAVRYLRDEGMGKSMLESRVVEEANMFCQHFIEPHLEEEMSLYKYLKLATSNIIFSMIFGKRFDYTDEQLLENNRLMEILFESNMTAVMSKNIPFAKWLPGDPFQHKLNSECLSSTMKYFDDVVAHRRTEMAAKSNPGLFVDNYLLHFTEKGEDSAEYLDRDMATTLMQIFGGGTDTSACFMNWAILFMCVHADIQEKVQQEIDSYIKCTNKKPSYKERTKLPYTEAVILEIIRCSMMLPTLLPHSLDKEVTIAGHNIPANTELIFNLQTVYNDPEVFESPELFHPDRFLSGDIQTKKYYTGVAFGLGRRSCPGEPLARMEMFLFFTTVLEKYRLRYAGEEAPSTKGICGTINFTKPYSVICTRRKVDN